jgi:predicted DNA-binding transcriptional regulator YafY
MLETSARLLRLLTLLQARRFWSGAQLAEALEVTERTVRRDVDRLRSLGYPVDATSGVAGGYQLGAGARLPPLLLDDDEALAVAIGLRTAAGGTVTGIEQPAVRALAKLEQVLPARLRRRVNALGVAIQPLQRGPSVNATILATMSAASRDRLQVCFRYGDKTGKKSRRTVEPYGLVHTGYRWYLVAWDVTRDDWRTFRVDRVDGAVTTAERFLPRSPPEDGDLRAYVSRSVALAPYGVQARIVVHAPLELAIERIPPSAGVLEALDDARCVLLTGAHSLDALAFWMAMTGLDFEVEHPPELVDHLRDLHARLGRAVKGARRLRR